ncbi:MAG: hypothetical protein Q4G16_03670 [Cruoricaptor ignavus]|nr:hypothetical protein [Cruoricaptor ignavus]
MEVNDHFLSQINDLMSEENLSFGEAFNQTKELWKDEFLLEVPFYVLANKQNAAITKIESRMKKEAQIDILKKSLLFLIFIFSILFVLFVVKGSGVMQNAFKYIYLIAFTFGVLPIFFNFFINYKAFNNQYRNLRFSIYHWRNFVILSFGYFGQLYIKPFSKWIPNIFNFDFTALPYLIVYALLLLGFIYTGISQLRFTFVMKRLKPIIKNL